jgi:hypothetical protein
MMTKRIFALSIVAILLSVSSLAAACDLSCTFASIKSDCHSQKNESRDSMSGGMNMDGMAMAGMTMPEMAGGEVPLTLSPISRTRASHPSIGEMGPCERQTCGNSSADSTKTSRSADSHLNSVSTITETLHTNFASPIIHDARDDVGTYPVRDGSLVHLSLRI